jgi:hypothetical protein
MNLLSARGLALKHHLSFNVLDVDRWLFSQQQSCDFIRTPLLILENLPLMSGVNFIRPKFRMLFPTVVA